MIAEEQPLAGWGSIAEVVNRTPENVKGNQSFAAVLFFWLTFVVWLPLGVIGGCFACAYRLFGAMANRAFRQGHGCITAPIMYVYTLSGLISLVRTKSRLGVFLYGKTAWGNGEYFVHGEGFWCTSYEKVTAIMRSAQRRAPAFGAITAMVPDLFASDILIFLSNDTEDWSALRKAIHQIFLQGPNYYARLKEIQEHLSQDYPDAKVEDLNNIGRVRTMVAKCIFFVMFNVWLTNDDAAIMTGWRNYAANFVLPRFAHRMLCNKLLNQVKQLRIDTVGLIEKHGLQNVFVHANSMLPQGVKRALGVKLCDEVMFVVGFAGIGGTSGATESVGQFLQRKHPSESPKDLISFEKYGSQDDMIAAYRQDAYAYIKETCRMDPPVTSATSVLKQEQEIVLNGAKHVFPEGTYQQYTLSLANRDPSVFSNPNIFDPTRENLDKAVTWNGCFGGSPDQEERDFPRICPGRYLALEVCKTIIDLHVSSK